MLEAEESAPQLPRRRPMPTSFTDPPRSPVRFWPFALALVWLVGCGARLERAFEQSADGPSRTGLLGTPLGVVLGTETGKVLLVSEEGEVVWRAALHGPVSFAPALVGQTVVVTTGDGEWAGLELATGKTRWRLADQVAPIAPLATSGELAVLVGADGRVRGIDGLSGALRWERSPRAGAVAQASARRPRPLTSPPLVALSVEGTRVEAVDGAQGTLLWEHASAEPVGLEREGPWGYVLERGGRLAALELAGGKPRWSVALEEKASGGPSLAHGWLWVGLAGGALEARSPADGARRLRLTLPSPMSAGVCAFGDYVAVPTSGREGRLLLLRPEEPQARLEARLDSPLRSPPVVVGRTLFILSADGRVVGFRAPRR